MPKSMDADASYTKGHRTLFFTYRRIFLPRCCRFYNVVSNSSLEHNFPLMHKHTHTVIVTFSFAVSSCVL